MKDWILVDAKICAGKPVIRGTRIMVKNIQSMMTGGYTIEDILIAYTELTKESIEAAIEYFDTTSLKQT